LIRGDALLVLNLGLDLVDGVAGLDIEGNGLSSKGLNKNLFEEHHANIVRGRSQQQTQRPHDPPPLALTEQQIRLPLSVSVAWHCVNLSLTCMVFIGNESF